MDLVSVTAALVGATATKGAIAPLLRALLGDSKRGLRALETIASGDSPATDGPEARTVQRILIRKALTDDAVKDELVAGYRLVGGDADALDAGQPEGAASGVPSVVEVDVFDSDQVAALHRLGITTVADLLGAAETSRSELARTLDVDTRRFDELVDEVAAATPDHVMRRLDRPIPEHGYGLALGDG
ncbi:MAG TPA: hypothetical protein VF228_03395 [Iamia sp.]